LKNCRGIFVALCALALSAASVAHAKPVGTLSCTSSTGQVKFNVSYFTFGVETPLNIGSQSSGAGAGKVTFQPLEVHAALSTFASLVEPAASGKAFQNCILRTTFNDGSEAEFEFKLIAIETLTASASMPAQPNEPARYTDVKFEYGQVEVRSVTGIDDGGTGSIIQGGWNQVQNQND
jgi:hypothetical protein